MATQSLLDEQLSLVQGAWLMISETVLSVLSLAGGVAPPTSIMWPDQAFYGFVCSAKDVSATTISIVMSTIGGVVQSAGQTPVQEVSDVEEGLPYCMVRCGCGLLVLC